ncbi:hypothetical protein N0V94_000273 [Neodidymelliopsis sp. IMI 364377]|nr:hypothetical protein N0V94_000273 [Neodidymelliopsis sp. IMI 364377]
MGGTVFSLLVAVLAGLAAGNAINESLTYVKASTSVHDNSGLLVAVPFGTIDNAKFRQPSLVQTAGQRFDPGDIASDEAWEIYKAKGNWYTCLLDLSNENAGKGLKDSRTPPSAESRWQGNLQKELETWGWTQASYSEEENCDFRDTMDLEINNRIGTALSSLGLSLQPKPIGTNECYSIEHFDETWEENGDPVEVEEQDYEVDGRIYPCTGAYYRFATNKAGGAIFAQNLLKPQSAAEEHFGGGLPADQLPQLSRASDVMWGYWIRNNPDVKNLRFWFANFVKNDVTLPLLSRALKNHGLNKMPYWPGLELKIDSSPIGSTAVHFLLQHKSALGIKTFGSITIFRDNTLEKYDPEPQLLFKIIDVPQDKTKDSDKEMKDAPATKFRRTMLSQDVDHRNVVREHRVVQRYDLVGMGL